MPGPRARLCMVIAAALVSLSAVSADAGQLFVVIVPLPRPPDPPPVIIPAPPLQWAPPPTIGLTPGVPSPAARCYAGPHVCQLERTERVGEGCTCDTPSGHDRACLDPTK